LGEAARIKGSCSIRSIFEEVVPDDHRVRVIATVLELSWDRAAGTYFSNAVRWLHWQVAQLGLPEHHALPPGLLAIVDEVIDTGRDLGSRQNPKLRVAANAAIRKLEEKPLYESAKIDRCNFCIGRWLNGRGSASGGANLSR
jgi:hypothetical protein